MKILVASLATSLVLFGSSAWAAVTTATITKIDAAAHTVTLSDHTDYAFGPAVDLSQFQVGEKVTVEYTPDLGANTNNATFIYPAA
jgi:hypothetical protein